MVLGKVISKPSGRRKPNFLIIANVYQPFTHTRLNPMKLPSFYWQFHLTHKYPQKQQFESNNFWRGGRDCPVHIDVGQHPWLLLTKCQCKPSS